jgi:hypothetical protein
MKLRHLAVAICSVVLIAVPLFAFQPPPPGQSEFIPLKELPPTEQLPAAPLLVTAYAFFLVLMVFYVWTVWRRLNKVEREIHTLEQKTARSSR